MTDRLYTQADLDAAVAAEREACAQVADDLGGLWWSEYKNRRSPFAGMPHHEGKSDGACAAAAAIRERGET